MPKLRPNGKYRVTFEADQDWMTSIEVLRSRTKATNTTEVFRRGIALFDHITSHLQSGDVILRHPDGREENLKLL